MKRQEALDRIEARRGFFVHLSVYVVVSVGLVIINLLASPAELWFQWPLMGWGIAVVLHGLSVFAFAGRFGITEEMIEREMRKDGGL